MQDSELKFTSPVRGMQIRSEVRVSKPASENGRMMIRWHHVYALWDTGASTSGISRKLADKLSLKIYEHTLLSTAAGQLKVISDIVLLDLMIGGLVIPVKAAVVDAIPGAGNDFLIGMDVIQCGTLTIDTAHVDGDFHISFKPYPGIFNSVEQIFKKK